MLKYLNGRGTPSKDSDQIIYNQVIKTYGTHYVTSVIVGGSIFTYTFLNQSYAKSTSYQKQEEQIRISVEVGKLKLSGDRKWTDLEQTLSEDFKKNSRAINDFHPTVAEVEGKTPWNVWLEKASQQPVVVNRTLSRMSDLLIDYPVVQTHLQKTIDFYVRTGDLPKTLQEVQNN
jgi:hypothetical protein